MKKILLLLLLSVQIQMSAVSPIISYSFDQGAAVDDGGNYQGSFKGNSRVITLDDGNKVLFTASGYLDLGEKVGTDIFSNLNGNYTISVDFCVRSENNLSAFSWLYAFANGTNQYLGLINTPGNSNWYYEVKHTSTLNTKTNTGISENTWHNITVVQYGLLNMIYLDGKLKSTSSMSTLPYLFAGNLKSNYFGKSPFSGDLLMKNTFIDNFKIYNSALTSTEIATVYQNTSTISTTTSESLDSKIIYTWEAKGNPVVTHKYTADPAALVYNDTLFIFTGQDAAGGQAYYNIPNWCVFATTDMKNYVEFATPLRASDFSWATQNAAWAGQVIERDGKFYWYTSSNTTGIGVAVSNRPEGPYKDALGRALLTNENSPGMWHSWRTIDPSVMIDDDGQAWLYWGNGACWVAKLNSDMISIDASYGVKMIAINGTMDFPFTEAPWIHKKGGKYYLSYAAGFPERIEYAISDKAEGPYQYKGILNEIAGNSNTNHQAILEYKGQWYFVYHNGGIQTDGGSFSRSLCIDKLEYDENGDYKPIIMTTKGVDALISSDLQTIKNISVNSKIKLDRRNEQIILNDVVHYQVFDSIGRKLLEGKSKIIQLNTLYKGVFILKEGDNTYKFNK